MSQESEYENEFKHLYSYLMNARSLLKVAQIDSAINQCRRGIESICKQIRLDEKLQKPTKPIDKIPLDVLISDLRGDKGRGVVPQLILDHLATIQKYGNFASHDRVSMLRKLVTKLVNLSVIFF